MPTLTRYDIDPGGMFHLGRRGIGEEETGVTIPADTLFAALIATCEVELGQDSTELTKNFTQNGKKSENTPFILSSAFPRAGDVCFFPALPLNRLNISRDDLQDRMKEMKRVKFISEKIFRKAIAGEDLNEWLPLPKEKKRTNNGIFLQKGELWLSVDEVDELPKIFLTTSDRDRLLLALREMNVWKTKKVPRVTIDRITNRSAIYHTGCLYFQKGCGFWFGVEYKNSDLQIGSSKCTPQEKVKELLSFLADSGLGGSRSSGYGYFSCEQNGEIDLPNAKPEQPFVTLSRYHPRQEELPKCLQEDDPNEDVIAYQLISIAGWAQSPAAVAQRRRRLWFLEEGSIVRAVGDGPWGDITDVRPAYDPPDFPPPDGLAQEKFPHSVWRYGLACPVLFTPSKEKSNEK